MLVEKNHTCLMKKFSPVLSCLEDQPTQPPVHARNQIHGFNPVAMIGIKKLYFAIPYDGYFNKVYICQDFKVSNQTLRNFISDINLICSINLSSYAFPF